MCDAWCPYFAEPQLGPGGREWVKGDEAIVLLCAGGHLCVKSAQSVPAALTLQWLPALCVCATPKLRVPCMHTHAPVQVLLTTLTVGSSLTVALLFPDQAEKIFAVVGATAVCVVCYVLPVFIQLRLYSKQRQRTKMLTQVGCLCWVGLCSG